jgi:hypothetical protein
MPVSLRVSVGGPKCSNNEVIHFGSLLLKYYDWSAEGIRLIDFLPLHSEPAVILIGLCT